MITQRWREYVTIKTKKNLLQIKLDKILKAEVETVFFKTEIFIFTYIKHLKSRSKLKDHRKSAEALSAVFVNMRSLLLSLENAHEQLKLSERWGAGEKKMILSYQLIPSGFIWERIT